MGCQSQALENKKNIELEKIDIDTKIETKADQFLHSRFKDKDGGAAFVEACSKTLKLKDNDLERKIEIRRQRREIIKKYKSKEDALKISRSNAVNNEIMNGISYLHKLIDETVWEMIKLRRNKDKQVKVAFA